MLLPDLTGKGQPERLGHDLGVETTGRRTADQQADVRAVVANGTHHPGRGSGCPQLGRHHQQRDVAGLERHAGGRLVVGTHREPPGELIEGSHDVALGAPRLLPGWLPDARAAQHKGN